jgi:hypothetical protein
MWTVPSHKNLLVWVIISIVSYPTAALVARKPSFSIPSGLICCYTDRVPTMEHRFELCCIPSQKNVHLSDGSCDQIGHCLDRVDHGDTSWKSGGCLTPYHPSCRFLIFYLFLLKRFLTVAVLSWLTPAAHAVEQQNLGSQICRTIHNSSNNCRSNVNTALSIQIISAINNYKRSSTVFRSIPGLHSRKQTCLSLPSSVSLQKKRSLKKSGGIVAAIAISIGVLACSITLCATFWAHLRLRYRRSRTDGEIVYQLRRWPQSTSVGASEQPQSNETSTAMQGQP